MLIPLEETLSGLASTADESPSDYVASPEMKYIAALAPNESTYLSIFPGWILQDEEPSIYLAGDGRDSSTHESLVASAMNATARSPARLAWLRWACQRSNSATTTNRERAGTLATT